MASDKVVPIDRAKSKPGSKAYQTDYEEMLRNIVDQAYVSSIPVVRHLFLLSLMLEKNVDGPIYEYQMSKEERYFLRRLELLELVAIDAHRKSAP